MRRWTSVALVLPLIGLAALLSNARGRQWIQEAAAEQVEDALDAVAITDSQRATLEDFKNVVAARLESRIARFGDLIRRVFRPRSYGCQLKQRFQVVTLPGEEAIWVQLPSDDASFPQALPSRQHALHSCGSVARVDFPRPVPSLISAPVAVPKQREGGRGWNRVWFRAPAGCNTLDCRRDSRAPDRG